MNSGIYLLYNIYNGRKYVGSSRSLGHRKSCHFSGMARGDHENYKIQKECNTYGIEAFRWCVLEHCEVAELLAREQWWIDSLKPEYNILQTATSHLCSETEKRKLSRRIQAEKIRGRKQPQEEKNKRAQSLREHWALPQFKGTKKVSEEQKKVLREKNMGENNPNWGLHRSVETKKMMSEKMSKIVYTFLSPDGDTVSVRNISNGGLDGTGLSYSTARRLYQGKSKVIKGWSFIKSEKLP